MYENIIIYSIFSLILMFFGLKEMKKVEITSNSNIPLMEMFLPKLSNKQTTYYILINIILSIAIYYFKFWMLPFNYNNLIEIIKCTIIFQSCFMLSAIDLKSFKIPNKYTFPLIIGMFLFSIFNLETLLTNFLGLLIGFLIIFILQIINPSGIGGGDAKLCALLGLLLGCPKIVYGVLGGFVLGGFFALVLLKSKLISRKDYIPYGIYFFIASMIVYVIL